MSAWENVGTFFFLLNKEKRKKKKRKEHLNFDQGVSRTWSMGQGMLRGYWLEGIEIQDILILTLILARYTKVYTDYKKLNVSTQINDISAPISVIFAPHYWCGNIKSWCTKSHQILIFLYRQCKNNNSWCGNSTPFYKLWYRQMLAVHLLLM